MAGSEQVREGPSAQDVARERFAGPWYAVFQDVNEDGRRLKSLDGLFATIEEAKERVDSLRSGNYLGLLIRKVANKDEAMSFTTDYGDRWMSDYADEIEQATNRREFESDTGYFAEGWR